MRLITLVIVAVQLACAGADANGAAHMLVVDASATPAGSSATNQEEGTHAKAAAVQAFQERIKAYVEWRKKVEDTVPKLTETTDPQKIAARERALGEALIKGRGNAHPGEYFIKEYVPILKQTIKADFAKRTAAERKALIVELPKGLKFGVNQIYPTTIPLATFPANLLKSLPDLPPELEYRIVHRHLILRDVEGNYVVDMVPNIFPIAV